MPYAKYYIYKQEISTDGGQTWRYTGNEMISGSPINEYFTRCSCENECEPPSQYETQYFTIVPRENGSIKFKNTGTYKYSTDSGETWSTGDSETVINTTTGNKVMFKAKLFPNTTSFWAGYGIGRFSGVTGQFDVEGNIMSLLNEYEFVGMETVLDFEFYELFRGCENLISAENLVLPATRLAQYCYCGMFGACTSITIAPVLPATTLETGCYERMFGDCTNLKYIECLATTRNSSTNNWVGNVAPEGTFVKAENVTTQWGRGDSGIPTRWYETDVTCHTNPVYNWVNMDESVDYYCEGTTKYYKQKKQVSYNCGISWQDVSPAEYQKGGVVEEKSPDCGYAYKLIAKYMYGDPIENKVDCNDNPNLTTGETKPSGRQASAMTSAIIGNCVTGIENDAFRSCIGLTSVTISNRVTGIGAGAFEYCTSLSEITLPDTVTGIGNEAFAYCSGLTSITCLAITPPALGPNAFYHVYNYKIYVPCDSVADYRESWSAYKYNIQGIQPCGPDLYRWVNMDASVDYYCEGTTKYYKQKRQVSHDDGETWQDVTPAEYRKGGVLEEKSPDCGYVFDGKFKATYSDGGETLEVECNSSTELTSGETQPSGYQVTAMTDAVIGQCVTTIGKNAFYKCSGLTSIDIPSGVTSIGNSAFDSCNFLADMTIPDSVTYIGGNAFYETLWWNTYSADTSHRYGNIIYINDIAYKATSSSITSVTFKSGAVSIGGGAFADCTGLTSVTIPDSITSISDDAFNYCTALTSVTIPDSVTSIGDSAFYRCNGLTSVNIPNSVTSIDYHAFWWCRNLASVSIGSGVTSIGGAAFALSSRLTSITVEAVTPPTLGDNAFNGTNEAPIYVPASSVDAYKAADGWSFYADRIQPIP